VLARAARDQCADGARTAILITEGGAHLRCVALAGMSETFQADLANFGAGPRSLAIGTAAHTGQRVMVEDVRADAKWAPFQEFAERHEIRACWSFPIVSFVGNILGTFEVYHPQPREAEAADLEMFGLYARSAALLVERHKIETTLRESEERYRTLFNSIDEGFAVVELLFDPNGKAIDCTFLEVNDSFEAQSGFCEAKGRRAREIIPEFEDHWFEMFGKVAVTGQPARFVNVVKSLHRWFDVYAFRVQDHDERRVAVVFNDITERKFSEETRGRLAAIVATSTDAIVSKTLDGLVTSWNAAAETLFCYTAAEMIGQPISRIIPAEKAAEEKEIIARVSGGERIAHFDTVRLTREGKAVEVSISISPIRDVDGVIVGASKIVRDITIQRQIALELERVREAVAAASRAKDEFLAALSHELRTPLTPVLLLATEAVKNRDLPADVRADFDTIRKNISLEARLIDDLLDLTRIATGKLKLELQSCAVHVVLRDVFEIVRGDLEEKHIALVLDLDTERPDVMADPVRLQQIFWNVLRNAVHFTPEDGTITVRSRTDRASGEVAISITDTGIGIGPEDLVRIFETFSQGEGTGSGFSRRFGGLGLGLAISRTLVEMHRGKIAAASRKAGYVVASRPTGVRHSADACHPGPDGPACRKRGNRAPAESAFARRRGSCRHPDHAHDPARAAQFPRVRDTVDDGSARRGHPA
jgi:PAS domain S-box-containing protein